MRIRVRRHLYEYRTRHTMNCAIQLGRSLAKRVDQPGSHSRIAVRNWAYEGHICQPDMVGCM